MVSGLAFRCLSKYSQKYRSRSEGKSVFCVCDLVEFMMGLLVATEKALKALAYGVHQFRDCGHVPVGIGDLDVPEVGRQRRHHDVNIDAVSMPREETATDEGVPHIVKARQPAARPHPAQSTAQVTKGPDRLLMVEWASVVRQEERWRSGIFHEGVANPGVLLEGLRGGGVKHYDPREGVRLKVHVSAGQSQGFCGTHACAGE